MEYKSIEEIKKEEYISCKKEIQLYERILKTKIYIGIYTKKQIEETIKYYKECKKYMEEDRKAIQ